MVGSNWSFVSLSVACVVRDPLGWSLGRRLSVQGGSQSRQLFPLPPTSQAAGHVPPAALAGCDGTRCCPGWRGGNK